MNQFFILHCFFFSFMKKEREILWLKGPLLYFLSIVFLFCVTKQLSGGYLNHRPVQKSKMADFCQFRPSDLATSSGPFSHRISLFFHKRKEKTVQNSRLGFQVSSWQICDMYLAHVIEQPIFRIPILEYLQRNFCFDFFNDSENTF